MSELTVQRRFCRERARVDGKEMIKYVQDWSAKMMKCPLCRAAPRLGESSSWFEFGLQSTQHSSGKTCPPLIRFQGQRRFTD